MNPDLPPALQQALTAAVAIQPTEVQGHIIQAAQRIQSGQAFEQGQPGQGRAE